MQDIKITKDQSSTPTLIWAFIMACKDCVFSFQFSDLCEGNEGLQIKKYFEKNVFIGVDFFSLFQLDLGHC